MTTIKRFVGTSHRTLQFALKPVILTTTLLSCQQAAYKCWHSPAGGYVLGGRKTSWSLHQTKEELQR